ncbi:MAG: bifunctional homocysteine S-methyltransferase/methylenetetrahydrofolate reductase [Planctomycetota bacterium]|jgi:homocysteine S-methyltransferase
MSKAGLIEQLQDGIIIGDGAMGTMLYSQGAFINTCFDELCLTRPDLIGEVHAQYVRTGCDFIETNSFGANSFKLTHFGLADQVHAINKAAAAIAKNAAGDDTLVAGSVGPSGINNPTPDDELARSLAEAFTEQTSALAENGIDFLLLETFTNVAELRIAIEAAAKTGLPIVAQMTCSEQLETFFGTPIEKALGKIAAFESVAAVGLNCSLGPSDILEGLKRIAAVTDKPISIQPNAGLPRRIEGRTLYMCTPEYMAEYAKRFYENGAAIIGGCCGTTPEHIKQIIQAVRPLAKAMSVKPATIPVSVSETASAGMEPVDLKEKSSFGAKLAAGEPVACIELTPPRGVDTNKVIDSAKLCKQYGIDAINIPDGPRASARLSPLVTALKIEQAAEIETILHICCRDKNLIGLQSDLLGIHAMGLRNVLLITGDPPKLGEYPDATGVFDLDSVALTRVVDGLNRGLDLARNELPQQLSLTIGVGANPVASELNREIERFKHKVDAGAEYVITQPVFDTEMFFKFAESVGDSKLPFIAGIWPFTSYKNAEFMANEVPGVIVPDALLERMSKAKTREDGRKIGIEIAQEMIETLRPHVAGFAVSAPFGNVKIALAALGKIDISDI